MVKMGKLQHYVPRFYLKAWLLDGVIFCLRNGQIFGTTNLTNLGGENYFYRLQDLTINDISHIKRIAIDPSPEHLKRLHHDLLASFDFICRLKEKLASIQHDDPEINRELENVSTEFEETLNTGIEAGLQKPLAAMLSGDTAFIEDDDQATHFFYALAHQYMRTKRIKEALLRSGLRPPLDRDFARRIWNVLSHIYAVNVGWSLFAERKNSKLVLLDNQSTTPFITADQPVINLQSSDQDSDVPAEKLDLYFPLSPTRAMLLLEANSDYRLENTSLSAKEVHAYNLRIARNAHDQIYSNSQAYLETIKSELL